MAGLRIATALLVLLTGACAASEGSVLSTAGASACRAGELSSRAGAEWMRENRWRFASDQQAAQAYRRLAEEASPWPDWYVPYATVLAPGTRFQMAIGGGQTPQSPGSFGTFDNIRRVRDVRAGLAVRTDWKPQVDQVVTYEVVRPLPVKIGPIGPQVDPRRCALLPGRWSQFQMTVERSRIMDHLKVVAVRRIR